MTTRCEINKVLFKAKSCAADISVKYVNASRFGYTDKKKELFNALVFLKGAIRIFNDYSIEGDAVAEDGVLNKFGRKALLSTKNPLSLESKSKKISVSEEELNCFSREKLCELSDKISSICSSCSTC